MYLSKPSAPINELAQYVVNVPDRYGSFDHLAIARDENTGLHIIGMRQPTDFPVASGRDAVRTVCDARAALTVRGSLLLRGQQIRPEDYLAIWRATSPVSIEDLATLHGIRIKALLELDMEAESAKKWDYAREAGPQSFAQFCATHGLGVGAREEVWIDKVQAFVDLATFRENCVRDKDRNYDPISRIQLVAEDCGGVSKVASVATPVSVQLELI